MLFGFIPTNLLEAALMSYYPISPRDDITEAPWLGMVRLMQPAVPMRAAPSPAHAPRPCVQATLPLRLGLWCVFMCMFYPVMLLGGMISAICIRLTQGTAADVLKSSLSASFKTGASYPCIFVFKKPFADKEKLESAFKELAEELGMKRDKVNVVFEAEIPAPFPKGRAVENDHYVDKGWNMFKRATLTMGGWHAYVRVFNGKVGDPTVVQFFLPGHTFDGTSCFNIAKETIARYYGERHNVVVQTTLTDEHAEALVAESFVKFLLAMPYNIFLNVADFNWMFLKSMRVLGGPGMSTELTMLNLSEEDSAKLKAGLKKRGIKPYAGFIYAAFHAYKHVEDAKPYAIVQQASMQTRSYHPEQAELEEDPGSLQRTLTLDNFKSERRFVGDWLIGCLHHFKSEEFTLEQAQQVYETLIENLDEMKGNAISGAMAKAYNPLGGAAVFQFFPFYAEKMRVMDGVFFNNYGMREIHPDADLVSYNWGAPFRLGFNTLNVNGKTCTCLASSHMSLTKLRKARDHVDKIFQELME